MNYPDGLLSIALDMTMSFSWPLPFAVEQGGKRWAVFTDGHALLALDEPTVVDEADTSSRIGADCARFLAETRGDGELLDLSIAAEWIERSRVACDECDGTRRKDCPRCDAKGSLRHDCSCRHCHFAGREECEFCDGDGWLECPCLTRVFGVSFNGKPFSLNLLRRTVGRLSGVATWHSNENDRSQAIRGDGWALLLMPIRNGETLHAKFPEAK